MPLITSLESTSVLDFSGINAEIRGIKIRVVASNDRGLESSLSSNKRREKSSFKRSSDADVE